jgi:hypothetical protein
MNVFACDPDLDGAGAILGADGDLIACFDLPVTAPNAASTPRLSPISSASTRRTLSQSSSRPAHALDRVSRKCSGSGKPTGRYLASSGR